MKIITLVMLSSLTFTSMVQAASSLYIHHKVADYPKWRAAFDAHKSKQLEAGLTNPRVYSTDGDKNNVSVLFDASDEAKAKAFTESKDLKDTMQAAGVQGKPDIHILTTPKM